MSLHFRYRTVAVSHPVLPLGGRWVRPRPLIPVTLIGPSDSRPTVALLDTGADDTIFSVQLAHQIGLDLTHAPQGEARGASGQRVVVHYALISLRLTDGREYREWPAWVGFTAARLTYPMLGFAGCLQFFTATFYGDREEVELSVNSLYRGT